MAQQEKTHDIEGLRITMRCNAGHEQTFEVAAFAPWIPVHCPQCPWHTLWRQVEEQDFTMKLPLPPERANAPGRLATEGANEG